MLEDSPNQNKEEKKELLNDGEVELPKTTAEKWQDFKKAFFENLFMVLKFIKGVRFFTTDTAGFEQFNTDLGQTGKKHTGYFNIVKLFL